MTIMKTPSGNSCPLSVIYSPQVARARLHTRKLAVILANQLLNKIFQRLRSFARCIEIIRSKKEPRIAILFSPSILKAFGLKIELLLSRMRILVMLDFD